MPFEERYRLLVDSGQASEETIEATRLGLKLVEDHYGIVLTEETGAMLATHLAITLRRLRDGEELSEAPEVVWEELQTYPDVLQFATFIAARLEELLGTSIPQSEVGFLALHLARVSSVDSK
jgi:transcriptional regulatory protein LevR